MDRTSAQLIVECLENEGVTHVFGIPGEENIRFVEALSTSSIEYVRTTHEQGAYLVADAWGNSTPLIAISAQVGMRRSFKESHQSVDLVSMFAPVTKWSALVATP